MVAREYLPAIRKAIEVNEGAKPYELGFAQKGDSGASFGVMQGDMHAQDDAWNTMREILATAGVDQSTINRLMPVFKLAWPHGNRLSNEDTALVNGALASPTGRPLVDAMDERIMAGILKDVDRCIAAASARKVAIAPVSLLYLALWINMSGPPTKLLTWLGGTAVAGFPPPAPPPTVGSDQLGAYLKASKFFQENAKNFKHFTDSAAEGAKLLPA